jgi:hypothetical protein
MQAEYQMLMPPTALPSHPVPDNCEGDSLTDLEVWGDHVKRCARGWGK